MDYLYRLFRKLDSNVFKSSHIITNNLLVTLSVPNILIKFFKNVYKYLIFSKQK